MDSGHGSKPVSHFWIKLGWGADAEPELVPCKDKSPKERDGSGMLPN